MDQYGQGIGHTVYLTRAYKTRGRGRADSGAYGEETMEMGPSSRAGSGRHTPATMRAMMVGDPTGQTAPSVTG